MKRIFSFLFLVLISPFFLTLLVNRVNIFEYKPNINYGQISIEDYLANEYRSNLNASNEKAGKIFANKEFFSTRFLISNYFLVFSPHKLFFDAPHDYRYNPYSSGYLYFSFFIFFIFGSIYLTKKSRYFLFYLIFLLAFIPAFKAPADPIYSIPYFISILLITNIGIYKTPAKLRYLIFIFLFFEIAKNLHNINNHLGLFL